MSHAYLTHWFAFACPWLALLWCLQFVGGWCGLKNGWLRIALPGLAAAGLLALPVQGFPMALWVAGLNANFSIPLNGLLAVAVWEKAFSRKYFTAQDCLAASGFGVVAGLVLYPLALGFGKFDPYEWGWAFSGLFVVIAALTGWLIWKKNRFGLLLLLAIMAWHLRLLESANYWDYLLDPVYFFVSIIALGGRLAARLRRRDAKVQR